MKKWIYRGKHSPFIYVIVVCFAFLLLLGGERKEQGGSTFQKAVQTYAADKAAEQMLGLYFPFFSFAAGDEQVTAENILSVSVLKELPIYGYYYQVQSTGIVFEDETTRWLITQYGQEETHPSLETEVVLAAEEELIHKMEQENRVENVEGDSLPMEEGVATGVETINAVPFIQGTRMDAYDWAGLQDYSTLVSTFYAIDANTMLGSDQLNVEKLISKDLTISKEDPSPQILIYHTHSKEDFADSTPGDASQTVVGVGDRLTDILTEQYGYGVLHYTAEFDTIRDDAYAKALPDIEKLLQENPSIQVVIDVHRDSGVEGVHRAVDINGRSTATFMLFNGISRTKKTGEITYLANTNLEDNLAFSFQMQVIAGEYYPGLTRKIYLKGYRYNMHLKSRYLLIELGDENNTLQEALNTCDPLAHILDMTLTKQPILE